MFNTCNCVAVIVTLPQDLGFKSKVIPRFFTGKLEVPEMILHRRDDIS